MNGDTWTPRAARTRTMTEKGIENALERKRRELRIQMHKLSHYIQNSTDTEIPRAVDIQSMEQTGALLGGLLTEFKELIEQTKEPLQTDVELIDSLDRLLHKSSDIVNQTKNSKTDKSSAISRHSRKSAASTSSSAKLRAKALADAAAARTHAEFERLIAKEEYEQKQREAEQERRKSSDRALHKRNIATLTADRKLAVATAKLDAINQIVREETGVIDEEDFDDIEDELDQRKKNRGVGEKKSTRKHRRTP